MLPEEKRYPLNCQINRFSALPLHQYFLCHCEDTAAAHLMVLRVSTVHLTSPQSFYENHRYSEFLFSAIKVSKELLFIAWSGYKKNSIELRRIKKFKV